MLRQCPFCGEKRRLKTIRKSKRGGDGEWHPGAYVRCLRCNARGPLADGPHDKVAEYAEDAWNTVFHWPVRPANMDLFAEAEKGSAQEAVDML